MQMKFHISDESLEIVLEGREKVWALKRRIIVPVETVINVEWVSSTVNTWRLSGLRAPGTGVPGFFTQGHFIVRAAGNFGICAYASLVILS